MSSYACVDCQCVRKSFYFIFYSIGISKFFQYVSLPSRNVALNVLYCSSVANVNIALKLRLSTILTSLYNASLSRVLREANETNTSQFALQNVGDCVSFWHSQMRLIFR